jgi:hypothetical protein
VLLQNAKRQSEESREKIDSDHPDHSISKWAIVLGDLPRMWEEKALAQTPVLCVLNT